MFLEFEVTNIDLIIKSFFLNVKRANTKLLQFEFGSGSAFGHSKFKGGEWG